jgi:hypothetical protein
MMEEVLATIAYLRDSIPARIRVTRVDRHDVKMLDEINRFIRSNRRTYKGLFSS